MHNVGFLSLLPFSVVYAEFVGYYTYYGQIFFLLHDDMLPLFKTPL